MRKVSFVFFFLLAVFTGVSAQSWVRVNNVGYLPDDVKVAVFLSMDQVDGSFEVYDASNDRLVLEGKVRRPMHPVGD